MRNVGSFLVNFMKTKGKIESVLYFLRNKQFSCILVFTWRLARKRAYSSGIIPNLTNGKSLTCWRLKFNTEAVTWGVCVLVVGQGGG